MIHADCKHNLTCSFTKRRCKFHDSAVPACSIPVMEMFKFVVRGSKVTAHSLLLTTNMYFHPNTFMRRQLEAHLGWKCPTAAALEKDPKKREFLKLNYGTPSRHLVENMLSPCQCHNACSILHSVSRTNHILNFAYYAAIWICSITTITVCMHACRCILCAVTCKQHMMGTSLCHLCGPSQPCVWRCARPRKRFFSHELRTASPITVWLLRSFQGGATCGNWRYRHCSFRIDNDMTVMLTLTLTLTLITNCLIWYEVYGGVW